MFYWSVTPIQIPVSPASPAAEEEEPFPGNGTTPWLRCLSLPSKHLPSSYFHVPSRSIICLFFVFLCVNLYDLSVAQAVLGCPVYLHLHFGNPNLCISRKKQNLSPHVSCTAWASLLPCALPGPRGPVLLPKDGKGRSLPKRSHPHHRLLSKGTVSWRWRQEGKAWGEPVMGTRGAGRWRNHCSNPSCHTSSATAPSSACTSTKPRGRWWRKLHSGSPHPTWTKPSGAPGKREIAERGGACSDHAVIIYHSQRYCISLKKIIIIIKMKHQRLTAWAPVSNDTEI